MSPGGGDHVSRLCLETWFVYALPAAEAARDLLSEVKSVLEEGGGVEAGPSEPGARMIERRLGEFELALARMGLWTDRWKEKAPLDSTPEARDGIRTFESWHRAYQAAIATVILCDACGQLQLNGSRLVGLYTKWKQAHTALRGALAGSDVDVTLSGRLVDELPFRRRLTEAGEPSPVQYLTSMEARRSPPVDADGLDVVPCFLNGPHTRFIREALRGLEEQLPEEVRVSLVRESLERLRASDRLSPTQLEILEAFVADLAGEMGPDRIWDLRQRLKSIERDLASRG